MKSTYQPTATEREEFRKFLVSAERRGITEGPPLAPGAPFVSALFENQLITALKAYDRLFDPDVTTELTTATGAQCTLPCFDDTTSLALNLQDGQQDWSGQSPITYAPGFPMATLWGSGIVKASLALLQDSAIDVAAMLADAFAARFARTIGPTLVASLLAASQVGVTGGANNVVLQNLIDLRKSVNPAYRSSRKVFWLLNDDTLAYLDGLVDMQNRPIFNPNDTDSDGRRLLYGYPIAICPAMPNIGATNKPIAFGATNFFVFRKVKDTLGLQRLTEKFIDKLEVGFQAVLRCNSVLGTVASGDSPVKCLQNAAA
jgi:HK97 family phage major capsid protein